ncbi:MAG TPA: SDR family NAD(P)-dependent oxidoreductase [Myxococcota bacterium]
MSTREAIELRDRVALVTGATSGIGAACARELAALGARVLLTGRSQERGERVLAGIAERGGEAAFVRGDVRDRTFCRAIVEESLRRFGRIDVLVNNAGISYSVATLETTDAQWQDTIETNLSAVFYLSRAALRPMLEQRAGSIINVSSDWGLVGGVDAAAYCASKGGVVLLTKAMALECARDGVRINAVCPGDTDTPMMHKDYAQRGVSIDKGSRESGAAIPMGRMATPEEVAHVVCFLASDAAAYLTGVALPIDGGHTAV